MNMAKQSRPQLISPQKPKQLRVALVSQPAVATQHPHWDFDSVEPTFHEQATLRPVDGATSPSAAVKSLAAVTMHALGLLSWAHAPIACQGDWLDFAEG